jgi:hypothetical protein
MTMLMTIEALTRVVPPPGRPWETFAGPWGPVEAEIGTPLPQEYKDFVRLYGSGYFMEFLGVYVPRARNPNCRLETKVRVIGDGFADYLTDCEELPLPLWPAPDGLVPFGQTDNGHYLLWVPRGPPDDWRVAVWHPRDGDYEEQNCGLTDFLAGLATGEVVPESFPADLVVCDHLFQPHHIELAHQLIGLATPPWRDPGAGGPAQRSFKLTWRLGGFTGASASRVRGRN